MGEPDFYTKQGVAVYVDAGVTNVGQKHTSRALTIIAEEAKYAFPEAQSHIQYSNLTIYFRAKSYVRSSNDQDVIGSMQGGTFEVAALFDNCPYAILSHEWGHLLSYEEYGYADDNHENRALFWDKGSVEIRAKNHIVLELCNGYNGY